MTDRLKALRRIRSVQTQIRRMADWHLAEAERAVSDVAEARTAIEAYIDAVAPTGALAEAAVRQVRRTAARHTEAEAAVSTAIQTVHEATAREKLVERRMSEVARAENAARERQDLERLIEEFAARAMGPNAGEP